MTLLAYCLGLCTVPAAIVLIIITTEGVEAAGKALHDRRWNRRNAIHDRAYRAGHRQARVAIEGK